jgi:hypothetical protein
MKLFLEIMILISRILGGLDIGVDLFGTSHVASRLLKMER